jgi:hypothetical protein
MGARTPEVPPGPVDWELPEPEPMELDAPIPPGRVRTVQRLVYYISEVLHEAKIRYLEVNKLLYAVLIASRKLRHYFQAHKISVVSSFPLRAVLHNPNATGNIAKWAAELVEFELDFVPRHAVKSQVLADFIVDSTPPANHLEGPRCSAPEPGAPALAGPTGPSSSTTPREDRGPVRACYSSHRRGTSSGTWCTWTLRPPTTWQSTKPCSMG